MGLNADKHDVRYPNIRVVLVGHNGNIFHLMSLVKNELRGKGVNKDTLGRFQKDILAADSYSDALARIQQWVVIG